MVDYNTHGGYFAPQGLLKINEGGSHEENPNGGVQLGVDQQGIPNLVEEDEMVYDDFVYSDNIKADKKFLEENNLPVKYAGKLYSEVAEALCDEIGEQNDPIALNGLNVSLKRLANAQESQKQAEEEEELLEALKNVPPEELAAMEEYMMQQQAAQQQPVSEEQIQPEAVASAPVEGEETAPAVPMMENGGLLNTYGGGGRAGSKGQKALNLLRQVGDFISPIEQKEITMPDGNIIKVNYAIGNAALPENIAANITRGKALIAEAANQKDKTVRLSKIRAGKELIRFAEKMEKSAPKVIEGAANVVKENVPAANVTMEATSAVPFLRRKGVGPFLAKTGIATGALGALGAGVGAAINAWGKPDVEGDSAGLIQIDPNDFRCGGAVRKFEDGTPGEVVQLPAAYIEGRRWRPFIQLPDAGYDVWGNGRFLPDDYAPLWGRIHAPSGDFRANWNFGDAPVAPVDYPRQTIADLGMLNEAVVTASKSPSRGGNGTSKAKIPTPVGAPDAYLSDAELDKIIAGRDVGEPLAVLPGITSKAATDSGLLRRTGASDTDANVAAGKPATGTGKRSGNGFDWRYLSPAIDAAMGLATAFTPTDHYDYTPIRPYLPYGRIRQQYERYNPIDQNLVTNRMMEQANANMRALRNAGLGPSLGANLLAADYNAGQNLGNALANVWDANNQRYNQVIAQNNAADAAIANYDWQVEAARANALNQFAPYNQRMALQTQMLNNQAEQDKYNALASYVDSAKQFFANKGREDLNRNMVNSNRAFLGYGIDRMNNVVYDKYGNPILLAACGGKVNKKK